MTAAAYPDRFDLTRIIGRAFAVIRHNLLILTALTLVLYGLPQLGGLAAAQRHRRDAMVPGRDLQHDQLRLLVRPRLAIARCSRPSIASPPPSSTAARPAS